MTLVVACMKLLLVSLCGVVPFLVAQDEKQIVYGKYYTFDRSGSKDFTDNSYFLYRPKGHRANQDEKLPIILEIHGGGFTGGTPKKSSNPDIVAAVNNGIAYVSVGYRLVATKYFYGSGSTEEYIHIDSEGRLSLDTTGKIMDDYIVRRGRQELNTKCSYDAAQMMEHLIAHADEFGLDIHRISMTGSSAGGGEIHYLTWVYHKWNVGRYTPVSMVYTNAQLDYPVQNILDRVWQLWTDDVGENTKLESILDKKDCGMIIGNPWCDPEKKSGDYKLCNQTWQDQSMGRFCGDAFSSVSLAEVRDAQVWPRDDPQVGKGMEVLWYNSLNMQKHQPKPFYLYIANQLNSTAGMNVVHNALYARNYAKYAMMVGINYTVYYTDYHGMTADDAGDMRFSDSGKHGDIIYNYRSSHDWLHQKDVKEASRASVEEQLLYHCFAFGIRCEVSPGPLPVSNACRKAIDSVCPNQRSSIRCSDCIHHHARGLMAAGCPKGKGAAQTCVNYCESRMNGRNESGIHFLV